MNRYDETQFSQVVALKQSEQRRTAVGQVRYSPWWLAVSTSLSLALFFGAVFGSRALYGVAIAFLVGVVMAPIPSAVVWWCWKAFGVERQRLDSEPELFAAPPAPPAGDDENGDAPAPETELMPGYELDGEMVAPQIDSGPAEAELRRKCLALVRAGMKRGSWSRSKVAEGPSKQMKGDEWDTASRELQRLGYFASGATGLAPVKDLADILKRLELAR